MKSWINFLGSSVDVSEIPEKTGCPSYCVTVSPG